VTPTDVDAGALVATLLAALRLLPTALLSPLLGGPLVPPPVRVGLALALGWTVHAAAGGSPPPGGLALLGAAARELALGVALALVALLPIEAARAGGRLIDTLRGATLSELHVGPLRQRESAVGDLLVQWCLVVGAWGGGDRLLIHGLLGSFARLPPGAAFAPATLGSSGPRLVAELSASALALAAPAAAAIAAVDLAAALADRFAAGAGPSGAAQPARAAIGLAALALGASAIAGRIAALLAFAGRAPLHLSGGGAP
jgi:type III secretory pathway component EscT